MTKLKPTVLEEAQMLVYGDRQDEYGHPRKNMRAIALSWNAYLKARDPDTLEVEDVAAMLLLMKVARFATGSVKRDTVADMAGYVAVLSRVLEIDE